MNTTEGVTPAQVAALDQAEAREREFDRKARSIAVAFIYMMLAVGAYSWLAVNGLVPAAPWSPIGQQVEAPAPDRPVVEIPEGYEVSVPQSPPTTDI